MSSAPNFYNVAGFFAALVQSAIDQHARVLRFHVIGKAGYVTRCAMEIDFHRCSSLS